MQPHTFVVEGDMLRETVEETVHPVSTRKEEEVLSQKVVNQGFLYSPAVTFGDFVLTGWSKADM